MSGFDPFGADPPPAPVATAEAAAWAAMVAALRPVAESVRLLADAALREPSWRPGDTLDRAAWIEGRKEMWRALRAAVETTT